DARFDARAAISLSIVWMEKVGPLTSAPRHSRGLDTDQRRQRLRPALEDAVGAGNHMAELCHDLRAAQARLAFTQALARNVELGFSAPPLAALLCLVERAGDCDGEAHEIALEHIVGGAALQRPDRVLFADRAGDEDERGVRRDFLGERERLHAIEAR